MLTIQIIINVIVMLLSLFLLTRRDQPILFYFSSGMLFIGQLLMAIGAALKIGLITL